MNIGKTIKALRIAKKFRQQKFAKAVGITQTAMSLIETNKNKPHPSTMKSICKVLGVPEKYIYILSAEVSDVSKDKQEMFRILFPVIEKMIKQIWL